MPKSPPFTWLLIIVLLSSIAIQAPLYNRHLAFNDEGYILNTSEQISKGAVLYRDKPGYVFPGLFYFLGLLFKIFGVSFILTRLVMAIVFGAMCLLFFFICRQMAAEWVAFCTALAFALHKVWAFPIWNIIGYATFSIFFLSLSAFFLIKYNSKPRKIFVFLCGLSAGAGGLCKQDYGGAVAIGFFFFIMILPVLRIRGGKDGIEDAPPLWKALSFYTLGGLLLLLPVLAYFMKAGALPEMFLNTFWAPLTAETKRETTRIIPLLPLFSQDQLFRENFFNYIPSVLFDGILRNTHHTLLFQKTALLDFITKLVHYSPYGVIILTAGVLGVRYWQKAFGTPERNAGAIFIFSVSLILTQHRPYDFSHLMQMYAPTLILLGFLVSALYRFLAERKIPKIMVSAFLGLVMLLYLGETVWATNYLTGLYSARLRGRRANIYLTPRDQHVWSGALEYIKSETLPDEPIFVMPYHSVFYFFSERRNPTKFDIVWETQTYASRDADILNALDKWPVRYIVYSPTQPAEWGIIEDYAPELMRQIRMRYSVDKVFGDPNFGFSLIVLKRKDG